jgi:LPS sulfotransferase NodH
VVGRIRHPAPLFSPTTDLDWLGSAERTVVVTSEARSGSTLLCHALASTGLVGLPLEYFQTVWFESGWRVFGAPQPTPEERRRRGKDRLLLRRQWWEFRRIQKETLPEYVDGLIRRRTGGNGTFALKIHWGNYARIRDRDDFDFAMLPQPISWVHIQRRDLVAQAVSYVKAEQSGIFAVRDRAPRLSTRVHFDDDAILAAYVRVSEGAQHWGDFFERRRITPIDVTYEDLDADYEGTISNVLTELGLPDRPVPEAVHRRQADDVNLDWAARFRALHPDLGGGEHPTRP